MQLLQNNSTFLVLLASCEPRN